MKKAEKNKLTKLLREVALKRAGNRCERCGKTTVLQLSHIYSRGAHPDMAWDIDNVQILCLRCHLYWYHKDIVLAQEWIKQVLPKERYDALYKKANRTRTGLKNIYKYKEIKEKLEKML